MNDMDVQATNTDCKPKLHKNDLLFLKSDWLITMLFQGQQRYIYIYIYINKLYCQQYMTVSGYQKLFGYTFFLNIANKFTT